MLASNFVTACWFFGGPFRLFGLICPAVPPWLPIEKRDQVCRVELARARHPGPDGLVKQPLKGVAEGPVQVRRSGSWPAASPFHGEVVLLVSVGLLAISVSVALAVRTYSRWRLVRKTFNEGLPAEGRVLDAYVLPGDQGRPGLQHAIVGFRAADGREYRLDMDTDRREPLGMQMRLHYLPSSPERALLVEAGRGTVRTVLTLLVLVCLGLVGILLTVVGLP